MDGSNLSRRTFDKNFVENDVVVLSHQKRGKYINTTEVWN